MDGPCAYFDSTHPHDNSEDHGEHQQKQNTNQYLVQSKPVALTNRTIDSMLPINRLTYTIDT